MSVDSNDLVTPITDPDDVTEEHGSVVVGNYQFIRPGVVVLDTTYSIVGRRAIGADPATTGTYRLVFIKQPGRDEDTLQVNVTVPNGTVPTIWSEGGVVDGPTVTFRWTRRSTATSSVTYGPG